MWATRACLSVGGGCTSVCPRAMRLTYHWLTIQGMLPRLSRFSWKFIENLSSLITLLFFRRPIWLHSWHLCFKNVIVLAWYTMRQWSWWRLPKCIIGILDWNCFSNWWKVQLTIAVSFLTFLPQPCNQGTLPEADAKKQQTLPKMLLCRLSVKYLNLKMPI